MNTKKILCFTGIGLLTFFLMFFSAPVGNAQLVDVVIDTAVDGPVKLPDGGTLTVADGGTVTVATTDEEVTIGVKGNGILFPDGTIITDPADQGYNADWFLNDNVVTIESGGAINVTALGTTTDINAKGIIALHGNTITNDGAISVSAVQTGVDYEARAFGIQTGYGETENPAINTIVNTGTIEVNADAVSSSSWSSSPTARAVGIQMGNDGQGSVLNAGTIDSSASTVDGWARAMGIKISCNSDADVTNTGDIVARAESENGDAVSQGIKIGSVSAGTIVNDGFIGARTEAALMAVAKGIQLGTVGDSPVTNNGVIEAIALSTGVGEQVNAMGIHSGGAEETSVTNTGAIRTFAQGIDDEVNSFGILGGWGIDTVVNSGLIQTEAIITGEDDTTSIGGKSFGIFTGDLGDSITNSGTVESSIAVSTGTLNDESVAVAVRNGCADNWDNPNIIINDTGGVLSAFGNWDFADSNGYRSAAHAVWTGDYSDVTNRGIMEAGGSITSGVRLDNQSGFFGIKGADDEFMFRNYGTVVVSGEMTAADYVNKRSGFFGVRTGGSDTEVYNYGTMDISGILTATDSYIDDYSGVFGLMLNDSPIVENAGAMNASGSLEAGTDIYSGSGVFGIFTKQSSIVDNAGAVTVEGALAAGDYIDNNAGVYGIRASEYSSIDNQGVIDISGALASGGYIDYNSGVYGIRAGSSDSPVLLLAVEPPPPPVDSGFTNAGVITVSGNLTAGSYIEENSGVFGIRAGEYAIIDNAGAVGVSGALTAEEELCLSTGVYAIRSGDYSEIDNTGSVGAVGELTAGGVIGRTAGVTGIRSGEGSAVSNTGSIEVSGALTAGDNLAKHAGVYGIRTGYDAEIANEGTVDVTGSLSSEAGIRKHAGVYGIRGGYDSILANSGAITVAGELTAGENFSWHTGVYGMRTCSGSTVTNTGTIDVTGTLISGDPAACNNGVVYGIRTGYDSTVVNTGEINAVLTDDSNTGYSAGIWMREDNNTIHQSGIINASGGEQSAAVIFGCPESGFAVINNTLNIMNGAQMTGDMLNLSQRSPADPSIATVNFGLAADGDGVAVPGTPDAGFSFTYDGSIWGFNDIDDSDTIDVGEENYWTVNAMGGETFLNGEKNWFNDVEVSADAVLGVGSGFTAAGNAVNSGTLYLGGNMAVSTVAGDYTNNAGATLAVGMGGGASDSLTVGGTATIDGGTLYVVPVDVIQDGESHTVLTAGTLAGAGFDEATADSTVLSFTIDGVSVANSLILDTHRQSYEAALTGSGLTSNQSAISAYLMNLIDTGAAGSLADVILILDTLPTAVALGDAINQMSPESFTAGSAMSALSRAGFTSNVNSRLGALRAMASNRVTGAGPALAAVPAARQSGWSPWVRGSYIKADQDGDINYRGYNYDSTGLNVGLDKAVSDRLTMGVTLGLGRASAETSDRRGEINGDSSQFGIYGTWNESAFYVDGSLMYAVNDYLSYRHLPTFGLTARGDYRGRDYGMYIGGGYTMVRGSWNLIPTASLQYGYHREEGFTETGAGGLNLVVDTSSADSLVSKLGVRVNRLFRVTRDVGITPEMTLQWGHEFGDRDQQATARFAGAPGAFTVSGVTAKRDSAFLGVGVTTTVQESLSLFVSYEGEYRSDFDAHNWQAGLRFEF